MNTNLERVAAKAQEESSLKFSSLAHHITRERIGESLSRMSKNTAPGIDHETVGKALKDFDLWIEELIESIHRKSYKPPAVRRVWIPKPGKTEKRPIGVPTVADRIAQTVVKIYFEPRVEPYFLSDSYGYRPGKSPLDAVEITRKRCWRYNWVLEFDIVGLFDNIDHELLMRAVKKHTDTEWIILYVERWLKAPFKMKDGTIVARMSGTPQGGLCKALHNPPYAKQVTMQRDMQKTLLIGHSVLNYL